jgi:hypothetical protein
MNAALFAPGSRPLRLLLAVVLVASLTELQDPEWDTAETGPRVHRSELSDSDIDDVFSGSPGKDRSEKQASKQSIRADGFFKISVGDDEKPSGFLNFGNQPAEHVVQENATVVPEAKKAEHKAVKEEEEGEEEEEEEEVNMDDVFGSTQKQNKTAPKMSSIRADGLFKIQIGDDSFVPNMPEDEILSEKWGDQKERHETFRGEGEEEQVWEASEDEDDNQSFDEFQTDDDAGVARSWLRWVEFTADGYDMALWRIALGTVVVILCTLMVHLELAKAAKAGSKGDKEHLKEQKQKQKQKQKQQTGKDEGRSGGEVQQARKGGGTQNKKKRGGNSKQQQEVKVGKGKKVELKSKRPEDTKKEAKDAKQEAEWARKQQAEAAKAKLERVKLAAAESEAAAAKERVAKERAAKERAAKERVKEKAAKVAEAKRKAKLVRAAKETKRVKDEATAGASIGRDPAAVKAPALMAAEKLRQDDDRALAEIEKTMQLMKAEQVRRAKEKEEELTERRTRLREFDPFANDADGGDHSDDNSTEITWKSGATRRRNQRKEEKRKMLSGSRVQENSLGVMEVMDGQVIHEGTMRRANQIRMRAAARDTEGGWDDAIVATSPRKGKHRGGDGAGAVGSFGGEDGDIEGGWGAAQLAFDEDEDEDEDGGEDEDEEELNDDMVDERDDDDRNTKPEWMDFDDEGCDSTTWGGSKQRTLPAEPSSPLASPCRPHRRLSDTGQPAPRPGPPSPGPSPTTLTRHLGGSTAPTLYSGLGLSIGGMLGSGLGGLGRWSVDGDLEFLGGLGAYDADGDGDLVNCIGSLDMDDKDQLFMVRICLLYSGHT